MFISMILDSRCVLFLGVSGMGYFFRLLCVIMI